MTGRASFLFGRPTFAGGMASVLDVGGTLVAYNDVPDPATADLLAIWQDWATVGDDLRAAMVKELESLDPASLQRILSVMRPSARSRPLVGAPVAKKSKAQRNATPPARQQGAVEAPRSTVVEQMISEMRWSGPTPHPDDLAAYEQIMPGAADRILRMAENQAMHRQTLEAHAVTSGTKLARRGQICGLVIGLAGLGASVWMADVAGATAGTLMGGSTLGSLVGVFVYGDRQQRREREQRWRQATSD